jgi:hypothetical protein
VERQQGAFQDLAEVYSPEGSGAYEDKGGVEEGPRVSKV